MKKSNLAYTLAEVVITMLIITVIVAISIKLTKSKLDNIISYTYYSAFDTLDTVAKEMIAECDTNKEEYSKVAELNTGVTFGEGETCDSDNNCSIEKTIPKTGEYFCQVFSEMVNSNDQSDQLTEESGHPTECKGTKASYLFDDNTLKDSAKADLVLRNGMRIYNLSQNPIKLEFDNNNKLTLESGHGQYYTSDIKSTDADGNETTTSYKIYTDEYGYLVYIDIDGSNGPGQLWKDIMPFFVTISGKAVPLYTTDSSGKDIGGSSKDYLMTSVYYWASDSASTASWALKSVSFKEGACQSGYISTSTDYCKDISIMQVKVNSIDTDCNKDICGLQIITPVKWF